MSGDGVVFAGMVSGCFFVAAVMYFQAGQAMIAVADLVLSGVIAFLALRKGDK